MKNIIFRSLAAVVAIAGAFASVAASTFATEQPHVKYIDTASAIQCTTVNSNLCTTAAAQFPCRVDVTIQGSVVSNYRPYNHGCATQQSSGTNVLAGTKTLPPNAVALL